MNVGKSTDAFYGVDANGDIADVGSTNNSNWWRKAFASKPALSSRFKTESLDQHICLVSFERATFGDDILRDFRATVLDFSHSGVLGEDTLGHSIDDHYGLAHGGASFCFGRVLRACLLPAEWQTSVHADDAFICGCWFPIYASIFRRWDEMPAASPSYGFFQPSSGRPQHICRSIC